MSASIFNFIPRGVARVGGARSVDFVKRVNYGRTTQPQRRSRYPQPAPATGRRVATLRWPLEGLGEAQSLPGAMLSHIGAIVPHYTDPFNAACTPPTHPPATYDLCSR